MRYAGAAVLSFLALTFLVVLGVMWGFGIGWFAGEVNIRSFDHVRQVYRDSYDKYNALQQIANNTCTAKEALSAAKASGDQNTINQRQTQVIAQENTYNAVAGQYNAEMDDHFRAKAVKPQDLPRNAPSLKEALATAGC